MMVIIVLYDGLGVFVEAKDVFWVEHLCSR